MSVMWDLDAGLFVQHLDRRDLPHTNTPLLNAFWQHKHGREHVENDDKEPAHEFEQEAVALMSTYTRQLSEEVL